MKVNLSSSKLHYEGTDPTGGIGVKLHAFLTTTLNWYGPNVTFRTDILKGAPSLPFRHISLTKTGAGVEWQMVGQDPPACDAEHKNFTSVLTTHASARQDLVLKVI
jgi:hypothetical protein